MTTQFVNKTPYLRTTRQFPQDPQGLQVEIQRGWTELANCINVRDIAIYDTVPIITGQQWFNTQGDNQQTKRQSGRQVFTFSDSNLTITHNIAGITQAFIKEANIYDGTFWYTLPYVDVSSANNQVSVKVSTTQIIVTKGAGSPPTIVSGIIVLEWLSQS